MKIWTIRIERVGYYNEIKTRNYRSKKTFLQNWKYHTDDANHLISIMKGTNYKVEVTIKGWDENDQLIALYHTDKSKQHLNINP